MSITKTPTIIQASTSVAAGLSKANAFATSAFDVSTYRRGVVGWSVINGSSSPALPAQVVAQHSPDGTTWHDFYLAGGSLTANDTTSGSCDIPPGAIRIRGLCYGHTTNAVNFEFDFSGEVG